MKLVAWATTLLAALSLASLAVRPEKVAPTAYLLCRNSMRLSREAAAARQCEGEGHQAAPIREPIPLQVRPPGDPVSLRTFITRNHSKAVALPLQ